MGTHYDCMTESIAQTIEEVVPPSEAVKKVQWQESIGKDETFVRAANTGL